MNDDDMKALATTDPAAAARAFHDQMLGEPMPHEDAEWHFQPIPPEVDRPSMGWRFTCAIGRCVRFVLFALLSFFRPVVSFLVGALALLCLVGAAIAYWGAHEPMNECLMVAGVGVACIIFRPMYDGLVIRLAPPDREVFF